MVLDVACGSGLGFAPLLDGGAAQVIGLDMSREALRSAAESTDDRISVLCADASAIPLGDSSVETVVSFETVEHLSDVDAFFSEVSRVLKDDGVFLLSTPNRLVSSTATDGKPRNPFHEREFSPQELLALLKRYWGDVVLLGQDVDPAFGVCPYWDSLSMPGETFTRVKRTIWKVIVRMPPALRPQLAKRLLGQDLYPGERDFRFTASESRHARVLVGVAGK